MGLAQFKRDLQGWMTNEDGDDICPDCWRKRMENPEIDEPIKKWLLEFSHPTASLPKELLATRRTSDGGWFASCEHCWKIVASNYFPHASFI
ncbi:MAG: hypothetical protein COU47_00350 [Candidatus Niyogibacteria bacterium CG10_big_fil_rev_8_21_14_0_10_46_36]|uniref:Uncharacterized protein n=1 Tax=Candidatus Niyogibacteria bacterium CG10_big_fil_rev_8_21_14_0_10_46_36 TaxID=1974726 RepID=A0A2H0TEA6_9BACT|nr:MAG: hypothetical protein COU47_00350 [Candidatus Niyogibacteria bacterium CG10_big_fil_rev_8_21_14_0_10_46_36]